MAVAALAVAALALSACSSGGSTAESGKVTLTLWHNYGTEQNAVATKALVDAYEKAHSNVTIKVVSQPGDNYFSLLQASSISRTGPDLAVMWTGLFALKYKNLLTNLKGQVPDSALANVDGLEWSSDNFDAKNGPYVMPLDRQFYIGFYSKKAFAKAGISTVPTTWGELTADCAAIKATGVTPIVYGNGGQSLGAAFYPWYDASYLMSGAYSVSDLRKLYDGDTKWNDPTIVAQFQKWAALKAAGCTNSDVQTKTDNLTDFTSGKAAMMIDGTWDTQQFTGAMKDDVAAFVPPFSDTPVKGVVDFAGDGFSVTKASTHKKEAMAFLAFLSTPEAAKIIDAAGLISDLKGASSTNPVNQQMLDFTAKDGFTPYPMLDNVVQPDVADVGSKVFPPVLGGGTSAQTALGQMNDAWAKLPQDQRGSTYK
jgi:raffinose/stachyose/melibiose transport system substrate-binding protein